MGMGRLATCRGMPSIGSPSFRMSQKKSWPSVETVAHSVPVFDCEFASLRVWGHYF